jgi:hypothetical protein
MKDVTMCDYSLEMYPSRPAMAGEKLVTTRFPSGSIGLTSPGQPYCAVCVADGTVFALSDMPVEFQARHKLNDVEAAAYVRLNTGIYRDGIRFEDGRELSLQILPVGITFEVAATPVIELPVIDLSAATLDPDLIDAV